MLGLEYIVDVGYGQIHSYSCCIILTFGVLTINYNNTKYSYVKHENNEQAQQVLSIYCQLRDLKLAIMRNI